MKEIDENTLGYAIGYALSRVKFTPTKQRGVGETDSTELAKAVIAHFKLCRWHVMHEPMPWHSVRYGPSDNDNDRAGGHDAGNETKRADEP